MEKYRLKEKKEIKKKKKCYKISVKYYLSFIFTVILIMILFLILIIITLTKLSKSIREEALRSGRKYMNKCLEGILQKKVSSILL